MVKKGDAAGDVGPASAVYAQGKGDIGFASLSCDDALAALLCGHWCSCGAAGRDSSNDWQDFALQRHLCIYTKFRSCLAIALTGKIKKDQQPFLVEKACAGLIFLCFFY